MVECFRCGQEKEDFLFLKVITPKGVRNICKGCYHEERYPIIRKPIDIDTKMKNIERDDKASVYQRLSRISGVARENMERNFEVERQNIHLKKIADRNFDKQEKETNPEGLVEHFHWIIMRVRKSKKMTRNQLAEKIGETERAIQLAEQGILPKSYYNFILKIEGALNLNLMKDEIRNRYNTTPKKGIFNFNSPEISSVRVKDLKTMGETKKETKIQEDFDSEDEFISDEEIDRILSGR